MELDFSQEELEFQEEVRSFLNSHLPKDIAFKEKHGIHLDKEDYVRWEKILSEKGWAAVNWPTEYGGTGWTPTQKYIWDTERGLASAPDVAPFGFKMVGPIIYTYGNTSQKEKFLPDILNSDVWWCQGYSEPNAGSDLASLKTTAIREGDVYIVNGTKTWTTQAQFADWMFCLVRTGDKTVKNQEAISFLLIDMNTPGITVSPIELLDEYPEVNEVNFDNVEVPIENLVGEEGKGWSYGKVLLTHERTNVAMIPHSIRRLKELKELAAKTEHNGLPLLENPLFAKKIATLEIELQALEFTCLRILDSIKTGSAPGPESSLLKIKGSDILQTIDELQVELAGNYALPFLPEKLYSDANTIDTGTINTASSAPVYFNNRKYSIFGGSNEIQRNIIAKAVLGL